MQKTLNEISKQFLCAVSLNDLFHGLKIENLLLEHQESLIKNTINSELVLNYPIKIDYQKAFIRYLVDKLEKNNCEVHEEFYEAYGRLVASGESKTEYFKHYVVGDSKAVISLRENINLISEGTTGLRTWQASLALAEWALKNKQILYHKNILELGSGIGLTSLVISLLCEPKHVFFSDCHTTVLKTLCENIKFNCEKNSHEKQFNDSVINELVLFDKILNNGVNISVLNLPWEDVDKTVCENIGKIDLILAADVVYDRDLFEHLTEALTCISENCKVQDVLLACTERNPDTLKDFLHLVGQHFLVEEVDCPEQENFIWCADPPVRFYKFNRH